VRRREKRQTCQCDGKLWVMSQLAWYVHRTVLYRNAYNEIKGVAIALQGA
jgi:hypothetical protein